MHKQEEETGKVYNGCARVHFIGGAEGILGIREMGRWAAFSARQPVMAFFLYF
jgi:hypothetical protein